MIGENYMKQIILSLKHWVNNNFALKENTVTSVNNMTGDVTIENFDGEWSSLKNKPFTTGYLFELSLEDREQYKFGSFTEESDTNFYFYLEKHPLKVQLNNSSWNCTTFGYDDGLAIGTPNFWELDNPEYPFFLICRERIEEEWMDEDDGEDGYWESIYYYDYEYYTSLEYETDILTVIDLKASGKILKSCLPDNIVFDRDLPEYTWESLPDKPFYETNEYHTVYSEGELSSGDSLYEDDNYFDPRGRELIFGYWWDGDRCELAVKGIYDESNLYSTYIDEETGLHIGFNYEGVAIVRSTPYDCPIEEVFYYEETLRTLDDKFISDNIARISDIPVDTVTNSELHSIAKSGNWDDLENKPFYEINNRVLIAKRLYKKGIGGPFEGAVEGYGDAYGILKVSDIIPGDTYTMIVNGVEYSAIAERCEDTSSEGNNGITLFSHGESPEDFSDAPVSFGSYGNSVYVSFENEGESYDIELYHVNTELKTLDEKFISSNIARISQLPIDKVFEVKYEVHDIYDVTEAYEDNKLCYVIYNGETYFLTSYNWESQTFTSPTGHKLFLSNDYGWESDENSYYNYMRLNYYTKSEIDTYELITTADIDTICGAQIVNASEVSF